MGGGGGGGGGREGGREGGGGQRERRRGTMHKSVGDGGYQLMDSNMLSNVNIKRNTNWVAYIPTQGITAHTPTHLDEW